jgi:DNA helicase-2/ATP-dependent DNA helicase PcrA
VPIDYQKELNPEQLDVVLHGDGPCLVLAGAGSGKTRAVTYRVAYLLEQGIKPEEILLLTFTNKAAKEMLNRVAALTTSVSRPSINSGRPEQGRRPGEGETEVRGVTGVGVRGGTFHSTASRILRAYAPLVGRSRRFTILDEDDSKSLIKLCLKEVGADSSRDRRFPSPGSFQSIYSYARNAGMALNQVLEERYPALIPAAAVLARAAEQYENRKHEADTVDFDDLLLLLLEFLENYPDLREQLAGQFRYVLVDEFQDTNRLQARLVQLLSSLHHNLLVVGDDAQSIYSFRAAEIRNILDFPKIYPGTKIFHLTANYRSSPQILTLANAIIKNNRGQFKKSLRAVKKEGEKPALMTAVTLMDEARRIVDEIVRLKADGFSIKEIAVLFRAAFHAQPLEYELMKRGLPYEFRGGLRFFERAHIKDVTAHLRLLANLKDEAAWLRVLGLYPGIGTSTAGKVLARVRQFENLAQAISAEGFLPSRAASGWDLCRGVLKRALAAAQPSEMIRAVVAQGYRDYLEAEQPDWHDRLDDLEQLAVFAENAKDLTTFLDEVSLAENYGAVRPASAERLILSTIHQAKGLEWDAVFVIGLRDGGFPSPRALFDGTLEEERRLFYVAATRARRRRYLTYALSDRRNDNLLLSGQPSMFLSELPRGIMEGREREGKRGEGRERDWNYDYKNNEPTIVLDDYGERKIEPKKSFKFLREVDEL